MKGHLATYAILNATSSVTDIVGSRIYHNVRAERTGYPCIVIRLQGVEPSPTKTGVSELDICTVEVWVYCQAKDGGTFDTLIDNVRTALDRASGTYESIVVQSVDFNSLDNDLIEEDAIPLLEAELDFDVRIVR